VTANALAALEPFVRAWRAVAPARERCGVCAHEIDGDDHEHLVELDRRALLCACSTCAALFAQPGTAHFHGNPQRVPEPSRDGPPPAKPAAPHAISYRVVPKRVLVDPGFQLDEAQWAALAVPVRLAFIFYNSRLARWVALYPSPGGAAESDVPPAAFEALAAATRLVAEVAPDVEALLVYGRRTAKLESFLAPIDACYRLVGEVRRSWQGWSGGDVVWGRIESFFADLRARARAVDAWPLRGSPLRDSPRRDSEDR